MAKGNDLLDRLPANMRPALDVFRDAGEPVWVVGGASRDLLLDKPVKDLDLLVASDALAWARRVADRLGAAYFPLHEARGVGRVVLDSGSDKLWIDVADPRFPDDDAGSLLERDLTGRDFTVNAIAVDSRTGDVVDPTGGLQDLDARVLRAASSDAIESDPLRILRGIRLGATHGFELEPGTRALMQGGVEGLRRVAGERVHTELLALLAPTGAAERVLELDALGALEVLMPELTACKGVTQSPPHDRDVFGHNVAVLAAVEDLVPGAGDPVWAESLSEYLEPMRRLISEGAIGETARAIMLKLTGLLHDVGKPDTRSVGEDGRIHFYRHDQVGARIVRSMLGRLRFSGDEIAYAARLVDHHLRPLHLARHLPPSRRAVYRFFRDAGALGPDIAVLSIADQRGKGFATDRQEVIDVVKHLLHAYFHEPELAAPVPLVDGHDVMRLARVEGPEVGRIIERLKEHQARGKISDRDAAVAWVRQLRKG